MESSVPYVVYESEQARNERNVKRLIIALVVAVVMLFLSNALWLWAWSAYDYSSDELKTVTIDGGEGTANYIGNDGSISYGENYGNNTQDKTAD